MSANINRRRLLATGAAGMAGLALSTLPVRAGRDGQLHEVEIKGFKFRPAKLKVRPGDTIRWTNRDSAPHDATAVNGSWQTATLRKGQSAEIKVEAGMSNNYICSIHPSMKARLVIESA